MRFSILCALLCAAAAAQPFDLVIQHGRVIDPESSFDAVRSIGIRAGKIAVITSEELHGRETIEARGLVVSPGFIDLHSHGQDDENYRYKARDGVTTALELEVGVNPVKPWYAAREGKSLVNFGATSGHIPARIAVMGDSGQFLPRDKAVDLAATPEQQKQIHALVKQGLDEGALGIGFGIAYVPKTSREEILDLFGVAAAAKRPCFVHMRYNGVGEPGVIDAMDEVLIDAALSGASLHIVHITSMALGQTPLALRLIEDARHHGIDVTTEAYPYTAASTALESAVFSDGWQDRLGISYGGLQWAATGERLTKETFDRYRKQGGWVIIHAIPEDMVKAALSNHSVMVASDGGLRNGKGHPRGAGTFARVLHKYVREDHTLTLAEAIRQMSLLPAQRLGLKNKGRIRIGADADITIFDAGTVTDKATFENPAQYSEGIPFVLVGGTPVVRDGQLVAGVSPGQPIRAK
jgi:N-acyl-D-aspartate/D-glutamate deacylase